jgi:hypothetical protein
VEEGLSALAARAVPTIICWGGRDFCFNDHFYQEWRARFPCADCHYFPEAGHYVLEDARSEISALLETFFTGSLAGTPPATDPGRRALWFPRSGVGTRARAAPAACMIRDAGASKGCVPTLERGYDGAMRQTNKKLLL